MIRAWGKHVAECLLTVGGTARRARLRYRSRTAILAYHNVVPDTEIRVGDRSLHLARSDFAGQLDRLMTTHRVISLPKMLATPGGDGGPAAVITFDDAYRGVFQVALPELKRRGLPATVFVAPGLLGDQAFWWDLFADPESGRVPPEIRRRALEEHRGQHERIMADEGPGRAELPALFRSATEAEVAESLAYPGLTIGSHTWSHPNLTRLASDELVRELERSWAWLRGRFARVVSAVAYPYGLVSADVEEAAARVHGYGFGLQGGLCTRHQVTAESLYLPRVNIPAGVSLKGFELRTTGVLRR
jgi:peptidoglycan/xylan/chitin deacetylase (PgdA/CDA1 family)